MILHFFVYFHDVCHFICPSLCRWYLNYRFFLSFTSLFANLVISLHTKIWVILSTFLVLRLSFYPIDVCKWLNQITSGIYSTELDFDAWPMHLACLLPWPIVEIWLNIWLSNSLEDPFMHRSIVRALQYVTFTGHGFAFAVNKVYQFLSSSRNSLESG